MAGDQDAALVGVGRCNRGALGAVAGNPEGTVGGNARQVVRDVDLEAVNLADQAGTNHRAAVTHELRLREVRGHQVLTGLRVDDEETIRFRHVLFVQHAGHLGQQGQRGTAGDLDRRAFRAEVVRTGVLAGGSTLVGGSAVQERVVEAVGVNGDFHLRSGIGREHIEQLRLGLHGQKVIQLEGEALAAVDHQLDGVRRRSLIGQARANGVVGNGDVRDILDDDLVTDVADLAFPVGIGDGSESRRRIELGVELGRPDGRDEGAGVRRRRIEWCRDGVDCTGGDGSHELFS